MVNICKNIKKKRKHAQITFPFGIWTSYEIILFSFPTPSSEIGFFVSITLPTLNTIPYNSA